MPAVTKALEEKRSAGQIGSSFEAAIKLLTKDQNRYNYLDGLKADLTEIFKVSLVSVSMIGAIDDPATAIAGCPDTVLEVSKAPGEKCERCWNYAQEGQRDADHIFVCNRCLSVMQGGT